MSNQIQNNAQTRSLWIGEIEYWMDEAFIIKLFQETANVKNLKIIRDKVKITNPGYGFIEFDSAENAKLVLDEMNGRIIPDTNKSIKLNWASYSAGKQLAMSKDPVTDYSIYVGDLDLNINEEKLKDFFMKYYSSIISTKIIIDPVNKTSKGYGFVKFSDQNEATRALKEMNGKYLNGKQLKTNMASFKKMNSDSNLLSNSSNINVTPYNQYSNNIGFNFNNYSSDPNNFSPVTNTNLFNYQGINYNSNSVNNSGNPNINTPNYLNHAPKIANTRENLNNLNNFYIQNPNIDYTQDSTSLGSNYNLQNFYYNNFNNQSFFNNLNGAYNQNHNYMNSTYLTNLGNYYNTNNLSQNENYQNNKNSNKNQY